MKRSKLHFTVDAVAFAMFVFMVVTGVMMKYLLPAGSGSSTTIWGLDRHGWGDVHFWLSVVFLAALAVHVYLHWKWIVAVVRGRSGEGSGLRLGLGLLGLTALLAVAFAPLLAPVERIEGSRADIEPRWGLSAEAEALQGSTTLKDVVETTGVTLAYLIAELGLPPDVSLDDRLGQLARENGFSVADVREAVELGRAGAGVLGTRSAAPAPAAAVENDRVNWEMPATASREVSRAHEERFGGEHEDERAGLADIRGWTTLGELVELGVPLATLRRELGIPAGVPLNERLGRLGRVYGFTLIQVRDLVVAHR